MAHQRDRKSSNPWNVRGKRTIGAIESESSSQSRIEGAKKRLIQKNGSGTSEELTKISQGKGLDVELHPLLRGNIAQPKIPAGFNPVRQNNRSLFDRTSLNPYLDQSSFSLKSYSRPLQFHEQGKFVEEANRERERLQQLEEKRKKYEKLKNDGLTPNKDLGEQHYYYSYPPTVEWWDQPYLKDSDYSLIEDESRLIFNNEAQPISKYIQHPVLIPPPDEKFQAETKIHLTKKELKRKRRIERQERFKEQQDRIRLGLDPPPPPKIRLANLMNVLTNESIQDPTAMELKVRKETEGRKQRHLQTNEERKLTKEQKNEKLHQKHLNDAQKGYFSTVYRIENLDDPQHYFKVDINAKQLELVGICVIFSKFILIVVQGGAKGIKFYKKLLTKRINWREGNECNVVWEGQVKELGFGRWSLLKPQNEESLHEILAKFEIENYWRAALTL